MTLDIESLAREGTRLGRALQVLADRPVKVGRPDLAGLVRGHLVGLAYREGIVPEGGGWPAVSDWNAAGVDATPFEGRLKLRARSWLPDWLQTDDGRRVEDPGSDPTRRAQRRWPSAVPGDPFLPHISPHTTYRSPGQREAIRAVLGASAGRTVVAVLPTGSGKTLAVTGPARLAQQAHGAQTAMVVPTVALALDMERRLQEETGEPGPFAYHGGLDQEEKVAFRERIRSGKQWIVVTSPEAITTSLASPLEDAARDGQLRYLAIDEAHVVIEWGDDFRPAFQALAGFRRRLLAKSIQSGRALTTVLLTGTLDDHGLRTLRQLFAEEEPILVAAQTTRPEPAYWRRHCLDEATKRQRLVEAVRHLPKPLLVYATLKSSTQSTNTGNVEDWLKEAGFTRLLRVDGDSTAAVRRQAVKGLRLLSDPREDLDIVVANSAFGLGVDIPDIRAVIHVCVPETIDRFYQEVGRSGRDGQATASLLLWTDADEDVACKMSRTSSIGDELGWKRWESMSRVDRHPETGHLPVSLTAFHAGVHHPGSEANRMWNIHTLTTMERAKMIRLHWSPPPDISDDDDDEEMQHAFEVARTTVEVEVLQGDLGIETTFRQRFRAARRAGIDHSAATLSSMVDLLTDETTCINRRFAALYELRTGRGSYGVDDQCGGCPADRAAGRGLRLLRSPLNVHPPGTGLPPIKNSLAALLDDGSATVFYVGDVAVPWAELTDLVRRLVDQGVRHLVLPPGDNATRLVTEAMDESPDRWVCRTDLSTWAAAWTVSTMATAVIVPPAAGPELVEAVRLHVEGHPAVVAVVPRNLPSAPDNRLYFREAVTPAYSIETVLKKI